MPKWVDLPLNAKLFLNIDEAALTRASAAVENGYVTEADGHSRFPGLSDFCNLADNGRAYLYEWRGDMIAATSKGRVYRVDKGANAQDVTGTPITGGGRVIFSETEDELLMAAGGQIIMFNGETTSVLSEDAPLSTHVGYIDGYVIAIERDSGRFFHANAGAPRTWDPLDTFAADGNPDNIKAMMITQYREILLAGPKSIEQFERLSSGDVPFFRRWAVGEGILTPYAFGFADNAVFTVNSLYEVIRFSGQTSQPLGDDIGKILETIDDWSDAWMGAFPDKPLHVNGQKFVLLQIPNATNIYGTKGYTFIYNYKKQQWSALYGWDADNGIPRRWPGWSYWPIWSGVYVGGEGKIYKFNPSVFTNAGETQRWLVRTAHLSEQGEVTIEDVRLRIKRGMGSNTAESKIALRANRDNKGFGRWVHRGLGKAGERDMMIYFGGFGVGSTWQFEVMCTDNVQVELVDAKALITGMN